MEGVGDFQRRIPLTAGGVDDEAAIGLHRAAAQHRPLTQRSGTEVNFQLFEDFRHAHGQRLVENEPKCPTRAVIADEGHGLRKVGIAHRGHGDQ